MPQIQARSTRKYNKPISRKPYRRNLYRRKVASRVAMPKQITGNFASSTEQFSLGVTAGIVYDFNFQMADLNRTLALMDAYQYYRITSVELRFKPYFDTFSNALANGQTIPYLYFQYDKSGSLGGMTAPQMEEIGTKAIRLDDKTIIRRWKPTVITQDEAGYTTQFKTSPWMPTWDLVNQNLNLKTHNGAVFYISKVSPTDSTVYDVDVIVNVQFRKPLVKIGNNDSVNPPRITQTNETVAGPPKE